MRRRQPERSQIRVGKPDVSPTLASHTRGVREGNRPHRFEHDPGIIEDGLTARGTARRSTSINPDARNPIDPRMPNLSPS